MAATPAPMLDASHRLLMQRILTTSPEKAVTVAERIQDEAVREGDLVEVVRSWRRSDEAAADVWLSESGLSEEMKSKVLQTRQRSSTTLRRPR
jgi:hypothetical protein